MLAEEKYFAHATATIDNPEGIGKGTKVWHYSHIMEKASVGDNCNIGQNVFIDNQAVVGDRCKIQNNVSIYNQVILEEDVFCGPSCVFTNVINPRSFVERKKEFRKTLVQKGATIGANATIVCGVVIGAFALVGAGAVVTRDVLPYALIKGVPARQEGWVSRLGNVLYFEDELAVCSESGETYCLRTIEGITYCEIQYKS